MEILELISPIGFYSLALAAVLCALSMIFNENLVRAGFTLIGSFVAIAGLYFILAANFVGVSQILIYAVGIVLVIVFAIMLCSMQETASDVTNDEDTDSGEIAGRRVFAALSSVALFALLTSVITSQDWSAISRLTGADQAATEVAPEYTTQIGNLMLSNYILPFELVSVLLLVVLVGVIILSKKNISPAAEENN